MTSREEFEAWAITCAWLGLSDECMHYDEQDGYVGLELHAAWLAWQASRADMTITLPPRFNIDDQGCVYEHPAGEDLEYVAVVRAINAAGLKVAP
jgi:hypothetical protein